MTVAARLADRFGDNGLTGIVIGRRVGDPEGSAIELDNWLMSCRILGRRVEHALFAVIVEKARAAGAARLIGCYRPTERNGLVRDLYPELGFTLLEADRETGRTAWSLPLATARLPETGHLSIVQKG
jgi:FkbH-like protein